MSKLLATLLLAIAIPASAADLTPQYELCAARTDGITVYILECIGAETTYQDRRLNIAYDDLIKRMRTQVRKEKLRMGQRAWMKYRDESCQLYYTNIEDGSIARIDAATCIMSKTADRATELERIME